MTEDQQNGNDEPRTDAAALSQYPPVVVARSGAEK
jgi:hypothetical protein